MTAREDRDLRCTCFKDSKGRDIYEGDILDFRFMSSIHNRRFRGYVSYCNKKKWHTVRFKKGKLERSVFIVCAFGKPVVIGNIYKNPELLEQEVPDA